jgi:hypothetical protein
LELSRRDVLAGVAGTAMTVALADAARAGPAARRWFDVHMHVIGGPKRQFAEAVERAVAQMDALGVAKSVIFPPPLPMPAFDHPDYVGELKRYPGRFGFLGGGGSLNPMLHRHANPASVTPQVRQRFVDMAKQIADAGAAGYGEIAILHLSLTRNHPFEEAAPDHPFMLALAEVAGQRGLVIDLHMDPIPGSGDAATPAGVKIPPNPKRVKGNIPAFERLLAHEPKARIVWAHGGSDFTGNMTPALIGRLMDAHPNLFMSLRPIPPGVQVARIVDLRIHNTMMGDRGVSASWLALLSQHAGRFVLGADAFYLAASVSSDNPTATLARGNLPRLSAARHLLARLPPDLAGAIARDNAARLYSL